MLNGAMTCATCLATPLRDKLHEKLHRVTGPLQCSSRKSGIWKFVNDVTLSEGLLKNWEPSVIQSDLTSVGVWSSNNLMKLNPTKCKEMPICFFRNKPDLPSLSVGDQVMELVSSHKVLGLIIQDDFKWNEHIAMIVTKATKRLHILRVLRGGEGFHRTTSSQFITHCKIYFKILLYSMALWST
jgi:hypothetical protein